jgi:hypothetical protein
VFVRSLPLNSAQFPTVLGQPVQRTLFLYRFWPVQSYSRLILVVCQTEIWRLGPGQAAGMICILLHYSPRRTTLPTSTSSSLNLLHCTVCTILSSALNLQDDQRRRANALAGGAPGLAGVHRAQARANSEREKLELLRPRLSDPLHAAPAQQPWQQLCLSLPDSPACSSAQVGRQLDIAAGVGLGRGRRNLVARNCQEYSIKLNKYAEKMQQICNKYAAIMHLKQIK